MFERGKVLFLRFNFIIFGEGLIGMGLEVFSLGLKPFEIIFRTGNILWKSLECV